jgi:hypothetical protein
MFYVKLKKCFSVFSSSFYSWNVPTFIIFSDSFCFLWTFWRTNQKILFNEEHSVGKTNDVLDEEFIFKDFIVKLIISRFKVLLIISDKFKVVLGFAVFGKFKSASNQQRNVPIWERKYCRLESIRKWMTLPIFVIMRSCNHLSNWPINHFLYLNL